MIRKTMLAATVLSALLGAAALGGCTAGGDPDSDGFVIESARWQQSQAIPDFDSEPGDVTTPAQLERLAEIVGTHEVLQREDVTLGEVCDGGRSTTVEYVTEQGGEFRIRLEGCGGGEAADAIDDLVTEWREAR